MPIQVVVHESAVDGLPDMDKLVGRVAFLWDGQVISGWPVGGEFGGVPGEWEPAEDRFGGTLHGVTHWIEFPEPIWELER